MATVAGSRTAVSSSAASSSISSHPFTCVTCAIAFRSSELQRNHMRSDWHRYNLKRRVASLPPLSSEIFAEKVLSAQASSTAAAARASFEKPCTACQKTYYSENAFQNHIASQKHRVRVATLEQNGGSVDDASSVMSSTVSLGEPIETRASESTHDPEVEAEFSKIVDGIKDTSLEGSSQPGSRRPSKPHHSAGPESERSEHATSETTSVAGTVTSTAMPLERCLFCNYDSPTFDLSVGHMTKYHGMFIPEKDYLVDLKGLITYLQEKVTENNECLFCHKLKNSASAIQTHMRDKGHCMIAFDTEEEMVEVGQFYDFRSTYSDEEDESDESDTSLPDAPGAGVKLGAHRTPAEEGGDDEGDGWETDSDNSVASEDIESLPIDHDHAYAKLPKHRHHSHNDPRPHRNADGFHSHAHSHHAAFLSDGDLHLPTGRTAGHRSLARYYRQNLHSYPTPEERAEQRLLTEGAEEDSGDGAPSREQNRQLATRANGELGMSGVAESKKREVRVAEKRAQKQADHALRQNQWKINKQSNSQKHFRDPLLQ